MAEPLIRVEDATLGYGHEPVLDGVSLEVMPGDFLGLVGPNGAGKTTLLRGIIGLLKPQKGWIRVARDRTLGYVPQVQSLDPVYPLTVREVVAMGGYPRMGPLGVSEGPFLHRCLEEVGMAREAKRLFSRLSGGQKQRVLLARALFTRPDVLLLDEPTSGADHAAQQRIMELLKRLNGEGHTILLICHELDEVQRVVREVLWIHHGRVKRDSTAALLSEAAIREVYGDGC